MNDQFDFNLEDKPELNIVEVEFNSVKEDGNSSHHHHHHHHHRHHHSRSKKRRRKKIIKRVLIGVGAGLLALVLAAVGVFIYLRNVGRSEMIVEEYKIEAPKDIAVAHKDGQFIDYNGELYRYNENIANILIIGVDKYEETDETKEIGKNGQADTLLLAAVDTSRRKITLINIPRDILTDVKTYSMDGGYVGLKNMQICLSYAYGDGKESSCLNTEDAVQRVFYNLPIGSYFALDLAGVPTLNDAVGGVDVVSPNDLDDTGSSKVKGFVKGEKYHLEGEMSKMFVILREQHSPDANLKRNERQKVYLKAFFNKAISSVKKNPGVALELYNASAPYSCTDFNASRVTYFAHEIATGGSYSLEIKSVPVDVSKKATMHIIRSGKRSFMSFS